MGFCWSSDGFCIGIVEILMDFCWSSNGFCMVLLRFWLVMYGFWWKSDGVCMDLMKSQSSCMDLFGFLMCSAWIYLYLWQGVLIGFWWIIHCLCGHTKGDLLHCLWSLCEAYGGDPARAICSVGALDQELLLDLYDICCTISYISYTLYIYMYKWYLVLYIYIYIYIYIYQIILDNIVYIYIC